jgi:hypothetical protein
MTWTLRPADWDKPGHIERGDERETILDQVESLTSPGWTDYSASWSLQALSVNPTKGNSTYNAYYRRPTSGDAIDFEFYILIGSTFAAGSGVYRFPVPFNASAGSILRTTGSGYIFDNGTANRTGILRFEAAGYFNFFINGGASAITHTGSGTAWATSDIIAGSIRYEPA